MILQSLASYYNRLAESPNPPVPLEGYSAQGAHFALVLNKNGKLVQVQDLRASEKKKEPRHLNLPSAPKRTVDIAPNFLWDNSSYVLGYDEKGKPKRTMQCFEAFRELLLSISSGAQDEGLEAVSAFLSSWNPEDADKLDFADDFGAANFVFRLDGDLGFIHERPLARKLWLSHLEKGASTEIQTCLVSGEQSPISRLHPPIKGVPGANPTGASIVSFNLDAFNSYGKTQSYNAPVGEKSSFAYTTALNYLLSRQSSQRVRIADTVAVFWTEKPSPVETLFGLAIDPPSEDTALNEELLLMLEAVRDGKLPRNADPDTGFFLLGFSPNAARLSIRFWHVGTVGQMVERVGRHFQDLAIETQYESDPRHPPMWRLLRQIAVREKTENIPPLLAGAFLRSVITGRAYPQSILSAVIGRIRAGGDINYYRASMIKAVLVRKYRITNQQTMEVGMSLNEESVHVAYRLGRLFAVLEQAQKDAVPGANATIKDRFYGSASATPAKVFPLLLRLCQHHMAKAEYGWTRDKKIEEILAGISEFPKHLGLEDQGLFAIGYYHQRKALFAKKEKA